MNEPINTANSVQSSKQKALFEFYQNIKRGTEFMSPEDLDFAIESMKLARLDVKERERKRIQEGEAELLKKKIHDNEDKRQTANGSFNDSFSNDSFANSRCDNVSEALLVCIDTLGMVDIEFIATITGEEMKTVIEKLKGTIFQNPLCWNECWYKGWETADEYLSGNLLHKYHLAREANNDYPGYFDANIRALENLIEPNIEAIDIYITLGSPWVPTDIIDDFILHLVGLDKYSNGRYPKAAERFLTKEFAVTHDEITGLWEIPNKTRFRTNRNRGKYGELNFYVWGTERMDMLYLLEHILNIKTLAIYDYVGPQKKRKILNSNETVKILEKQDKMIAEFKKWVWKDKERAERLQGAYNRRFGNIRKRNFDGSFLDFPGMNSEIKLRSHQKNSVARIIFSDNTLLAHDVGAGKTYTMITAGMELRRLGKSQKNMYVIPNNIMPQWHKMFLELYPQAKILIVDSRNFNPKKRVDTLKKIANEDFDAILITYSCFDMISLSKEYYIELYENRLKELNKAKEKFSSEGALEFKRRTIIKALEKMQKDTSINLCEVPFDELGINTLFVDEAHNYKNVSLHSGISNMRGISNKGSLKCDAMMDKVHCVQRQNNGGRIIMATGTPITNSVTDLFIMQKYLQNSELKFLEIQNFDSWAAMFGKKVSEFEIDVDTNSYRLVTRFAKFCNIPELTAILSMVSDFYHIDNSEELPDFEGYSDIITIGSEDFKEYLRNISKRADDIRQKRVDKKEDNLLKITTDGRKAALDMRLIDTVYDLDINSKVYRCAENIMNNYESTRDEKLIQMVFCDTSTPKQSFNLYDELKSILVAMGMPARNIAYIHQADSEDKKNSLFYDLRKGEVSVVIGSTFKMGLGVNVQEKLCALHHLDVPWRPADMVQREGRILRQGNLCDSVKIYRYITKGSFDAYSWQLLEKKQRFISQILSGAVCEREGDDVDETVLNYAEVKALSVGNPLIKKKVEITNEIDKLRILQRDYIVSRQRKEQELSTLPEKIEKQQNHIADTEEDIKYYSENKIDYNELEYEQQKEIRDKIFMALKTNVNKPFETNVLNYQGFDVVVPARMVPKMPNTRNDESVSKVREPIPYIFVRRNGSYYMEVGSLQGITKRLNNLLEDLPKAKIRRQEVLETLENKKTALENELKKKDTSYAVQISRLSLELEKIDKKLGVVA